MKSPRQLTQDIEERAAAKKRIDAAFAPQRRAAMRQVIGNSKSMNDAMTNQKKSEEELPGYLQPTTASGNKSLKKKKVEGGSKIKKMNDQKTKKKYKRIIRKKNVTKRKRRV